MKPPDLRKRQMALADLRMRLTAPHQGVKPRSILAKPQAFLMEVGELFVYPTSGGRCINSYFSSKDKIPRWSQDGWGAMSIVERGRAFDFLAWYRPLTISYAQSEKPSLAQLRPEPQWVLRRPGTCSPVHFRRLELERIGAVAIDSEKLARSFPNRPSGRYQAVNDISLANELSIGTKLPGALAPALGKARPTIASLDEILSDPPSGAQAG
jgi:hypothetical protein